MSNLYQHPVLKKPKVLRKNYSTLGQANLTALSSLVTATGAKNQLIIRTQITPDITIDLNQLLSSDPNASQNAIQGQGNVVLSLVKPEILVNALGLQRSVAPYGTPTQNFSLVIGAAAIGLILLGGATAFWVCRRI